VSDRETTTAPPPQMPEPQPVARRSWKSRLIELALWAALSVAVALIMIALSNKLLPENF
jgi:hypothetical protein